MKEIWKKIPDYNYSVSNMGRVRNDQFGRILKPGRNQQGYFLVVLCENGIQKSFRVHRLVAMAFIANTEHKLQINHKNLIKIDNRVDNLEWCTSLENTRHAIKNGIKYGCGVVGNIWTRGYMHGMAKLTEKQVLKIRKLYATGNYFQRELAEKFNIGREQISCIINYKEWKHI